jgi:hypothetical protein
MAKRTTTNRTLVYVDAPRRVFLVLVEETRDDAPSSSSFPAAPEASQDPKPGLVKTEAARAVEPFPFSRRAAR